MANLKIRVKNVYGLIEIFLTEKGNIKTSSIKFKHFDEDTKSKFYKSCFEEGLSIEDIKSAELDSECAIVDEYNVFDYDILEKSFLDFNQQKNDYNKKIKEEEDKKIKEDIQNKKYYSVLSELVGMDWDLYLIQNEESENWDNIYKLKEKAKKICEVN